MSIIRPDNSLSNSFVNKRSTSPCEAYFVDSLSFAIWKGSSGMTIVSIYSFSFIYFVISFFVYFLFVLLFFSFLVLSYCESKYRYDYFIYIFFRLHILCHIFFCPLHDRFTLFILFTNSLKSIHNRILSYLNKKNQPILFSK